MASIELPESHTKILQNLVDLYRDRQSPVKGEDIADQVGRNPGTIRNQMQSLKALQLVEGIPGPKGGYKPTTDAYDALEMADLDSEADVPLFREGEAVEATNVEEVDLTSVHHPEECRAEVHVRGSVRAFEQGDAVRVGPTPLARLVIEGTVDGRDDTSDLLVLKITDVRAPADE